MWRNVSILKILLMARDRPLYFFPLAFALLTILLILYLGIVLALNHYLLLPMKIGEPTSSFIVSLIFVPSMPIFLIVFMLFAELYLNIFRVGWMIGLRGRKFLGMLIAWAENREKNTNRDWKIGFND